MAVHMTILKFEGLCVFGACENEHWQCSFQFSAEGLHGRRQSTGALTVTDPFLDAGYLLLPSCKQDHLQTEARKTWVFHFHQYWPSGSFQQNMDTPRAAVVIQNCSGAIAAELWSMYSAPCVFPSPPQQCALLVWLWLRIYPVYFMLGRFL